MCNHILPPFFYEIFDASLPRLAPGDPLSTQKAIRWLFSENAEREALPLPAKLNVLDLGCGNGSQSIELAKLIDGTILAVDNHRPFLDELQRRAELEGVDDKIEPLLCDMGKLKLDEESFDLIWSEGALFVLGVGEALKRCCRLLAPHGLLGFTELTWFDADPPAPCRQFFDDEYPAMGDVQTNLAISRASGFEVLDYFALPESAWWAFYQPLDARLRSLREKYASDPEKPDVIESIQEEIDIYRDYSRYYGYVFYLLKKR